MSSPASETNSLIATQRAIAAKLKVPDSKPKDKIKITAIVILVLAGLVAAFSMLCIMGILPKTLMGSVYVNYSLFGVSAIVAVAAGAFVWYRGKKKP